LKKKKVIAIVGPTAVGKTALGIYLANQLGGEIISGDSLQVYKQLDIGTAKATKEEQAQATHHLIDVREINQNYSVADFQKEGRKLIKQIDVPIIVGGTGLYVQSLLEDYSLGGATESTGIREKYQNYLEENGKAALWQLLKETDPIAADIIHENNSRKIIRALEVFENTGKSIINADGENTLELYDTKIIGLITDRELLYERINQRIDLMMNSGLLDEAKLLFEKYPNAQAAQGIGYKEFFPYFRGETTLTECVELVKKNSRNYAKRQITWFRNRMNTHWIDIVQNPVAIEQELRELTLWLNDGGN